MTYPVMLDNREEYLYISHIELKLKLNRVVEHVILIQVKQKSCFTKVSNFFLIIDQFIHGPNVMSF